MLKSYRDLLTWQKAIELALLVYRMTEGFPKREIYGLASQLRRAGVSVPSNIAEGYGRAGRREYLQFSLSSPRFAERVGNANYPGAKVGVRHFVTS